jgi:hypothetical protein
MKSFLIRRPLVGAFYFLGLNCILYYIIARRLLLYHEFSYIGGGMAVVGTCFCYFLFRASAIRRRANGGKERLKT